LSSVDRVLVVGGGIGGLATTIALRQRGIDVHLVELNAKWDVYGVGIIQPGNAVRALAALGVADQAVAAGFPMEGSRLYLADGTLLHEQPAPPRLAGPEYPAMNGITRPLLHEILTTAVRESGAEITLGHTVRRMDEAGDGVDVVLTDDTSGRYDLVVGADGINSTIREMLFGPEPQPSFSGQVCWRYNVPRHPDVDGIWMYIGPTGKAGVVPMTQELMYLLLIEEPPAGQPVRLEQEGLAATMRERLAPFGSLIGELRDQHVTDDAAVVYRPVDRIFLPTPWFTSRALVLGDAAHATSPHVGQGAAMALEDAVVLAEELAAGPTLADALPRWQERRYPRARYIYDVSREIQELELAHDNSPRNGELIVESMIRTAEPV
jgi:2-polyprenyl-6-methoxyphenol hydroxylase-like FAD-dependent oxidoreductase